MYQERLQVSEQLLYRIDEEGKKRKKIATQSGINPMTQFTHSTICGVALYRQGVPATPNSFTVEQLRTPYLIVTPNSGVLGTLF